MLGFDQINNQLYAQKDQVVGSKLIGTIESLNLKTNTSTTVEVLKEYSFGAGSKGALNYHTMDFFLSIGALSPVFVVVNLKTHATR